MKIIGLFEPDLFANGIGLRSRLLDPPLAGKPLLRWIVEGIAACKSIGKTIAVVQQRDAAVVSEALRDTECRVFPVEMPDVPNRQLMRRARKWALNCWSGGIGDTFVFAEEGNPAAMLAAAIEEKADVVVKFSAMSPFVDRKMVDAMVAEFTEKKESAQVLYSAAPPGFNYEIYSTHFLRLLVQTGQTLQDVLQIKPTAMRAPGLDPTITQSFFMVPIEISSSNYRFMVDSRRGWELVSALIALKGTELLAGPCADAVSLLDSRPDLAAGAMPREIEIELGEPAGGSDPAAPFFFAAHAPSDGTPPAGMRVGDLEKLVQEAAEYDDVKLTFRGGREALRSSEFARLLAFARKAGIFGLHVHTNGIGLTLDLLDSCIAADVDVVSVSFPTNDSASAAESATQMILARLRELGRMTPFVLPEMVVTKDNWPEQERFFDTWFARTGHVVLRSPDDLAGQLEDRSVMHLLPGRRRICERILSTLFVQADGRVPLCHVDGHRGGAVGRVGESRIAAIWQGMAFAALRESHLRGQFAANPLCARCQSWG